MENKRTIKRLGRRTKEEDKKWSARADPENSERGGRAPFPSPTLKGRLEGLGSYKIQEKRGARTPRPVP